MKVLRSSKNPIISPVDVKPSMPGWKVVCVFNAGVTIFNDEVLLLLRVAEQPLQDGKNKIVSPIVDAKSQAIRLLEFDRNDPDIDISDSRVIVTKDTMYLTSLSHFRIARSKDGINFKVEEKPAVFPEGEYEEYGIEDPRITCIDGAYYISYSAVSSLGICTCLIKTNDFVSFERMGVIFPPDNKDVEIFPEKINGKYYSLHRPSSGSMKCNNMWIAESQDLISWGNHRFLIGTRRGSWDSERVGGSLVPIKTSKGWLEIYHGADESHRYCLGAILLDSDEPWQVIGRTEKPIMEPEADYEKQGFFGNVVFPCGGLLDNGIIKLYYGTSDTFMAYAELEMDAVMSMIKPCRC